jgi:DNA-binding NarL/FixJ family response regulator
MSGLLNSQAGLDVVLECTDGAELLKDLEGPGKRAPHVILMDIQMAGMNGLDATRKVFSRYPKIKIIGLSMHTNDQIIYQLLENGACAFLPKNADMDHVIKVIKTVHAKGYYVDERMTEIMMKGATKTIRTGVLNPKEIEIIKLICSEYSIKEVGEIMGLSHRTIEAHKLRIQEKIGAKSVVGMVLYAMNHQLIPVNERIS